MPRSFRASKLPRIAFGAAAGLLWCAAGLAQVATTVPVTWGSEPFDIVAGPDGAMWFTDSGDNQIGRIGPDGTLTGYRLSTWSGGGIAPGPDGKLWFPEAGLARIASLTLDGRLSEFHLPATSVLAWTDRIAAGPDGNIWFTEHDTNQIGRISTSGTIAEFPVPTASAGLIDIAPGPDGNVWFAEYDALAIGRITPSGVITQFRLPFPSHPTALVSGPDGNIWYATKNYRVGRITPDGEITEFPTPAGSHAVVANGDSLWFLSDDAQVWRMSTSGALTAFVPGFYPPPNALGMGVGPDGAIWLTAGDGWDYNGAILRFAFDTSACVADATTLCLNQGRFRVTSDWRAGDGSTGHGRGVNLTANSGYFWFFDAANIEMVVKVLDGCASNQHQWVFAAGLTNVEVTTTVTDTFAGLAKTYTNPQGTPFAPIQDTAAFAACP